MAIIAVLLLVILFSIKYLICLFLMPKSLIIVTTPSMILMPVYKLDCSKIARRVT